MIDQVISRWRRLRPELSGMTVGLILHTSCLNYEISSFRRLAEAGFRMLLPDNVYWELRMMTRSKTRYAQRAAYLLEDADEILPWELEELYRSGMVADISRRNTDVFLFLFGDLNKQDEFLANVQPLDGCYILISHDWNWNGRKMVCDLNRSRNGAYRSAVAMTPSMDVSEISGLDPVLCWDPDGEYAVTSGTDYRKTELCGTYSILYTHPEYSGSLFKIYRAKAYEGEYAQKLLQLQAFARRFPTPYAALPNLLLNTAQGNMVGYSMSDFQAIPLRVHINNGWEGKSIQDMGQILSELFLKLLELHTRHILVNDLSYNNILVDGENCVYLVDCDSFQYYNFAGGAMTAIYRHRQIDPLKSGQELHMPMHEYFALAVLLFQFFVGGDPLFEPEPSWSEQTFALDEEGYTCEKVNECLWENWKDLEPKHRKMFVDIFRFREVRSIGAWIRLLELLE